MKLEWGYEIKCTQPNLSFKPRTFQLYVLCTVHCCYVLYIFDHTIQHKDDRFACNATFGAVGRNSIVFLLSLLAMLTAKCGNTKPKKSKGELWWLNLTSRKLDLTKILFLFTLE